MTEETPLLKEEYAAGAELGDLLHDLRLSREYVARHLGVSKHAIDNWCSGRSSIRLGKAGSLVKFLSQRGADPLRMRELLLNQIVDSGLDEQVARAYLGFRGIHQVDDGPIVVIVAHNLRAHSHFSFVMRVRKLLEVGHRVVVLDCCGARSVRRFYLEDLVPRLRPDGLIVCMLQSAIELDVPAANLARQGIPTVYVGERPRVLPQNAAFVGWDDDELGHIAGETVVDAGYSRIAILIHKELQSEIACKNGFVRALSERRPAVSPPPVFLSSLASEGLELDHTQIAELQGFLLRHRPQLVFAPCVMLGIALFSAFQSVGLEQLDSMACLCFFHGEWPAMLMQLLSRMRFSFIDSSVRAAATKTEEMLMVLQQGQIMSDSDRIAMIPCVRSVGARLPVATD